MNNTTLFKKAHEIARNTVAYVGDYRIAFSIALKDIKKPSTVKTKIKAIGSVFDLCDTVEIVILSVVVALCSFVCVGIAGILCLKAGILIAGYLLLSVLIPLNSLYDFYQSYKNVIAITV